MTSIDFDPRYNRDLTRVFTTPVLSALANGRVPACLPGVARAAMLRTGPASASVTVETFAEAAYAHLWRYYRAEYLYKNSIARKILLGRHSLATTQLFTELRAEGAKADVVLVNGTTTAYEIKTELDSLERLPKQLLSYCRVFDRVNVVTHRSLVARILTVAPAGVGVLELTDRGAFRTVRAAESNRAHVVPGVIFDTLRRDEYLRVIQEHYGRVPAVPNALIYRACRRLFERLTPADAHDALANALRRRVSPAELSTVVASTPASLTTLCLIADLNPRQAAQLSATLRRPLAPLVRRPRSPHGMT